MGASCCRVYINASRGGVRNRKSRNEPSAVKRNNDTESKRVRGVLNKPVVGMAATPGGGGYWLVATDGGIFAFGNAPFYGSTGSIKLNKPVNGMAATPNGQGYWMVASDGGIFDYGNAAFYGSTGSLRLNAPIVGMAATPSGNGYWLVGSDGGIFTENAPFLGAG